MIDKMANDKMRGVLVWWLVFSRIVRGAIFCHVRMVKAVIVVVPCDTSGSQKWNGAAAIFIIRAKVMIVAAGLDERCISQFDVFRAFIVAENRRAVEAIVWVRKYLVAASVARGWFGLEIIGVIDSVLISRHTHVISQCVVDVIIEVLRMMLVVITNQDIRLISRGLGGIFGVWAR